ncbi:uncharacterized protein VP01_1625g3 [Puccinia sorghi]|uniref:Uncharacterized protein n=1 Tax=Puccinia sorghi TaxID=27349 RepID=A0A0L6VH05_9BASI|nr:uncharacterized protein VP01_1625g3 [Puccinia sorghi]
MHQNLFHHHEGDPERKTTKTNPHINKDAALAILSIEEMNKLRLQNVLTARFCRLPTELTLPISLLANINQDAKLSCWQLLSWTVWLPAAVYSKISKIMLSLLDVKNASVAEALASSLTEPQVVRNPFPNAPPDGATSMFRRGRMGHFEPCKKESRGLGSCIIQSCAKNQKVLEQLKASTLNWAQIFENGQHVNPARPASFQDLQHSPLSPQLSQALQSTSEALHSTKGITRLYSHQARAIDLLADGSNVIVTTSTPRIHPIQLWAVHLSYQGLGTGLETTHGGVDPQLRQATFEGGGSGWYPKKYPYEELWRRSFPNLKFVLLEEGMEGGQEPFGPIHQFLSHSHQPAGGHEAPAPNSTRSGICRWLITGIPPKVGFHNYGDLQSAPLPDGEQGRDHCVLSDPQDVRVVNEAGAGRFSGEWATGDEETSAVVLGGTHDTRTETNRSGDEGRVCQRSKEFLAMLVNSTAWTNTMRAIQMSSLRPGAPRSRLICKARDSSLPIFNVLPTRSRSFQSPITSSLAPQSPAVFTTSGPRQSELLSFARAISLPTYLDQRADILTGLGTDKKKITTQDAYRSICLEYKPPRLKSE